MRRRFSAPAALLAAAAFALTPVAALMFRFNNPDALLTLLLVAAAYAVTRALEGAATRWLVLAGVLVGFGFLTKMLQALPRRPRLRGRLPARRAGLAAPPARRSCSPPGVALVAAAAWWVAIVALWPASSRPYIGGSQDNSILNLIFGYNGFGRITGNERGSVVGGHVFGTGTGAGGGGPTGGSMWGPTGITRLFGAEMGTQISWLLPAALVLVAAVLLGLRRAPRTDGRRAAVLLWGSWLVVTGLVFSFAQGIIHPYYTVALAPAIGALVGIGVAFAWARRDSVAWRLLLAATLDRHGGLGVRAARADAVLAPGASLRRARGRDRRRRLPRGRPAALGAEPPRRPRRRSGSRCSPRSRRLPPTRPRPPRPRTRARCRPPGPQARSARAARVAAASAAAGEPGRRAAGPGSRPAARRRRAGSALRAGERASRRAAARASPPAAAPVSAPARAAPPAAERAGSAGCSTPARRARRSSRSSLRRPRATAGSPPSSARTAPPAIELATGDPVMAIGGFNGTDPDPTLAAFKGDVAAGQVHYFIASSGGGGTGGGVGSSASSTAIARWVESTFTATTVGGVTVYDLARGAATA